MKKLFVSVPMKGRTEAEIKDSISKMKQIAEIYEGEELELIDSYIEDNPPENNHVAIWYLGKSLEKLANADIFIGIADSWEWGGCHVETMTANIYGIKTYRVDAESVIPNYDELLKAKNKALISCPPKNS